LIWNLQNGLVNSVHITKKTVNTSKITLIVFVLKTVHSNLTQYKMYINYKNIKLSLNYFLIQWKYHKNNIVNKP